jgi:hypothetical protein
MYHLETSLLITTLVAGMPGELPALADGRNTYINGSHIVRVVGNPAN